MCCGTQKLITKKKYNDETERDESERQLRILRYMAKAGDAYQAKQAMLREFTFKSGAKKQPQDSDRSEGFVTYRGSTRLEPQK